MSNFKIIFALLFFVFLGNDALANQNEKWFDAFDTCKEQSQSERDSKYEEQNIIWQGKLVRVRDEQIDVWLEPIDGKANLKIIRSTIGLAYPTRKECKKNEVLPLKLVWGTPRSEFNVTKKWYRADLHKNSCDLPTVSMEDISTWLLRSVAHRENKKTCELTLLNGPLGYAILVACNKYIYSLAETIQGCKLLLKLQKVDLPEDLYEQYGWEK